MRRSRTCRSSGPHGHTDPRWYALNEAFPDPARLLIVPDHYIFRMLFSQGIALESLGVPRLDGAPVEGDGRAIWRIFAQNYHLFSRHAGRGWWMDFVLSHLFGIDAPLTAATADASYDAIAEKLAQDDYRPARPVRALQTSRRSPPPRARWTICAGTRSSATAAGTAGWSPPTGRIR